MTQQIEIILKPKRRGFHLVTRRITGRFFDPLKMADVKIMNEIKTL